MQPLSLEDAGERDAVSLSIAREQIKELPGEDLADAIETLSGEVQHAVFSALDSEKAAEVLVEAEPRAQRQLMFGTNEPERFSQKCRFRNLPIYFSSYLTIR